jgi:hypothetical protein
MENEPVPYIQAAALCEQVIEEKSGVLSLIRIIDTIIHTEARPDAPTAMPVINYPMKLVIMLKSGLAKGRHEIKVFPELPSGEVKAPFLQSIEMEGEESGANSIISMMFSAALEGLYWFNVHFDGSLLTRIPLRVKYHRVITPQPPRPYGSNN